MRKWPTPPLGSLVETVVPARDKPEELDGPIPWLRIEDFDGMWVEASRSGQGVSPETVKRMKLRVFPAGTVVCTCSCDMGTTAIVRKPLVTNQTFIGLVPRDDRLRSDYLYWVLQAFREQLNATATGAIQQYLSQDDFRSLRLPLPPRHEQRAIADFIGTEAARVDALITKKRCMISLLGDRLAERARRGVLLDRHYRDPLGVSGADSLPPDVRPMRLSWLAQLGSGTTPESGQADYYDGPIPWVLTGDLNDEDLMTTTRTVTPAAMLDYSALKLHSPGSLVVAMYGATIGKMSILKVAATVNQACCVITPGRDLDPGFLFFYLLGFRSVLIERGRGSGQPNISQEILRSLRLAVPPVELQTEVAGSLSRAKSTTAAGIAAIEDQIALLQEHRQALITAAVTGEIDIPGTTAA